MSTGASPRGAAPRFYWFSRTCHSLEVARVVEAAFAYQLPARGHCDFSSASHDAAEQPRRCAGDVLLAHEGLAVDLTRFQDLFVRIV